MGLDAAEVRRARRPLLQIAEMLRSPGPLDDLALRLVRDLVTDGATDALAALGPTR